MSTWKHVDQVGHFCFTDVVTLPPHFIRPAVVGFVECGQFMNCSGSRKVAFDAFSPGTVQGTLPAACGRHSWAH